MDVYLMLSFQKERTFLSIYFIYMYVFVYVHTCV